MHVSRLFAAAATAGAIALYSRPAPADDHTAAEGMVHELEQDAVHRAFIADAVAHARGALERATRLRAVDDALHAAEADALAREWAEIARDRVGAADAEDKAADLRRRATEAQAKLERTRALVEEGIARIGRLQAELAETLRSARTAVEVHDGSPLPKKGTDTKAPDAAQKPDDSKKVPGTPSKVDDPSRAAPPKVSP